MLCFRNSNLDVNLTVVKVNDALHFKAKEIAGVLGYAVERKAVREHVSDKYRKTWDEIKGSVSDPFAEHPQTVFVTEPGLYQLICSSKLPAALEFQDWVFEEVLPQIRKTGRYIPKEKKLFEMKCFKIENEFDLHKKVVNYIRCWHPTLLFVAGLGELQDTPGKRICSWQKGYQKGQPDLIITSAHKDYCGFCIEFKTPKGNGVISSAQEELLGKYANNGYKVMVANDYDLIINEIKNYCDGVRLPCGLCPKKFKSQETLNTHLRSFHRTNYLC